MDSLRQVHARTRAAYNLAAQRYHDLFHDELDQKEFDRRLLDHFAELCGPGALVLDAGCGPSGHIGRYVSEKGPSVIGIDISDRCAAMARRYQPGLRCVCGDMADLPFGERVFDGIIAYYAIIDTPKKHVGRLFGEFHRVLKPGGYLLVAVKAGTTEGYLDELLGIHTRIYFTLFTEQEIRGYYRRSGFSIEAFHSRDPYHAEIAIERIFAIGRKEDTVDIPK